MWKKKAKYEQLNNLIKEYTSENVVLAFSGGVDSSLLLRLLCDSAKKADTKVYAVTIQTRLHPHGDIEIAKKLADEMGAVHLVLQIDELTEAGIENNPPQRCYLCKKALFQKIKDLACQLQVTRVVEGTNEDDLHQYRPGIVALKELAILSPLAAYDKAGSQGTCIRSWNIGCGQTIHPLSCHKIALWNKN